jgi:hypothetical protein
MVNAAFSSERLLTDTGDLTLLISMPAAMIVASPA